jgi:hypothetical protein
MAMTPKERQLVDELFDKLASLESAPRDAEAARAIGDGLQRAPNALYPLVQTVLLQDEALKRSDARVRELESELGIEPDRPAQPEGFLDSMRDTSFGRREPQGSVPSVRPGASSSSSGVWNTAPMQPAGVSSPPPGYSQQEQGSSGGSFLGTAAATAAGVIGGALLMNSLRGMFGGGQGQGHGQGQGQAHRALDPGQGGSPWAPPAGGGDLAREAGIDDIGGAGGHTASQGDGSQRAGLFDVASNDEINDENAADFDDDDGFDLGDGDTA